MENKGAVAESLVWAKKDSWWKTSGVQK